MSTPKAVTPPWASRDRDSSFGSEKNWEQLERKAAELLDSAMFKEYAEFLEYVRSSEELIGE